MYYDLHFAASYVFGESLLVGNYRSCIERAENVQSAGLGEWACKMKAQEYHELYTHAFVSMWSAFETGIENMVATYLRNDLKTAQTAHTRLSKKRQAKYSLALWPWTQEACLDISSTLEIAAKDATANGGTDLFGRLKTMLGWLDLDIVDSRNISADLAEANRVRNILLHRYGEVAESDAAAIPALSPWVNRVMPVNSDKFWQYQKAVSETILAAMAAVRKSRHHPPDTST